jgi:hypothetical protein
MRSIGSLLLTLFFGETGLFRLRLGPVAIVVLVLLGSWSAGDDKDTPLKARGTLPANWKKLGLTDDQIQAAYKVQAKYKAQIDELTAKVASLKKEEHIPGLRLDDWLIP